MIGADAIRTGEAAELSGYYLDATAAYESALSDPDQRVIADAHFHLGRVAWRQAHFDEALQHYEVARAICVRTGDSELRARVENGVGVVHHTRGELTQASAGYSVALDLTKDDTQRARVLLNLGAIANIQGDLETARGHYARSRDLFRRVGFRSGEASALHNLGMLHADLEQWDDADDAYSRCLELCEAQGNKQMIAKVLNNRVDVSVARGHADEAIGQADLALALYSELSDEVGRGETLRAKGNALREAGQLAEAERALHDAARIGRRMQIKLLEAESSRDLARLLVATGDTERTEDARKCLARAMELFEELGAQREIAETRSALDQVRNVSR